MESELTKAIRLFIEKTKITKDGPEIPGETEQTKLLHAITDALEEAVDEGKRIAGKEERGLVSAAKNLAGRAVKIVGGIVSQIKEKAQDFIDQYFGSEDDLDVEGILSEIEDEIADWAEDYSEIVSITEITDVIEETVMDELEQQGVDQVYWATDSDPCEKCEANAEASPVPIGTEFPSGHKNPPAHPRCRCSTARG